MSKVRVLVAAGAVLVAAGCTSSSSDPAATPVAAPPPVTTAATPAACPDGAYTVTELEGRGAASAAGKGTGGNIGVTFTDGNFTIGSDGTTPVKLKIGPASAEMRFTGTIAGTYTGDPAALALTTTKADGDVTVKGFGFSRSRSAGALANQLIGQGATANVTCDPSTGGAVVVLPNASLTLARA